MRTGTVVIPVHMFELLESTKKPTQAALQPVVPAQATEEVEDTIGLFQL